MNVFDYFFENTKELEKLFVVGKDQISFKDLYSNSLKLASYIKKNFGSDNQIALVSDNSIFFITVYLSILKSGNVCVPLSSLIEKKNLEYIISLTNCSLFFLNENSQSKVDLPDSVEILSEKELQKILDDFPDYERDMLGKTGSNHDQLSSIIFTSGSTGVPKGVMLSHKNIITNTDSILTYLMLTDKDRVCVVMPFYYCYGLSLLHTHLRVGGSIVLNNSFMFLGSVIKDLKNYACSGFAGVPSHFQILLTKSESFKTSEFPNLKYVTQAGGRLHDIFIRDFVASFPKIKFYVMYGQTEATARLSYLPPEFILEKTGSVGKEIPGVRLFIVNEKGEVLKPDEEGEIVAKGGNIMLGYFKDLKETENTLKNGYLYTGDIGYKDKDGFIYVIGRKKQFIKVSGKRVSPKEIEEVILNLKTVKNCFVKGEEDPVYGESIVAEVVPQGEYEKKELIREVLQHCKTQLAAYKVPNKILIRNNLRISSTGKILN